MSAYPQSSRRSSRGRAADPANPAMRSSQTPLLERRRTRAAPISMSTVELSLPDSPEVSQYTDRKDLARAASLIDGSVYTSRSASAHNSAPSQLRLSESGRRSNASSSYASRQRPRANDELAMRERGSYTMLRQNRQPVPRPLRSYESGGPRTPATHPNTDEDNQRFQECLDASEISQQPAQAQQESTPYLRDGAAGNSSQPNLYQQQSSLVEGQFARAARRRQKIAEASLEEPQPLANSEEASSQMPYGSVMGSQYSILGGSRLEFLADGMRDANVDSPVNQEGLESSRASEYNSVSEGEPDGDGAYFGSMYNAALEQPQESTASLRAMESGVLARQMSGVAGGSFAGSIGAYSAFELDESLEEDTAVMEPSGAETSSGDAVPRTLSTNAFDIDEWMTAYYVPTTFEETSRVKSFAPPKSSTRVLRLAVLQAPNKRYVVSGGRRVLTIPSVSSSTYDFDEVCEAAPTYAVSLTCTGTVMGGEKVASNVVVPLRSSLLTDMGQHVLRGHRCALLMTIAPAAAASAHAALGETLGGILSDLERTRAEKDSQSGVSGGYFYQLDASVGLMRSGQTVEDLSVGGTRVMHGVVNPVIGHWLEGMTFLPVSNNRDVADTLRPVRGWMETPDVEEPEDDVLALFFALRQVDRAASSSAGRGILLSSLVVFVSKRPRELYHSSTDSAMLTPAARSLMRRLSAGCFMVAATFVTDRDAESMTPYLTYCRMMGSVHLSTLSAGDLNRYLAQIQNEKDKLERDDFGSSSDTGRLAVVYDDIEARLTAFKNAPEELPIPFFLDRMAAREEGRILQAPATAEPLYSPPFVSLVREARPVTEQAQPEDEVEQAEEVQSLHEEEHLQLRQINEAEPQQLRSVVHEESQAVQEPSAREVPEAVADKSTSPIPMPTPATVQASSERLPVAEATPSSTIAPSRRVAPRRSVFMDCRVHRVAIVAPDSGFVVRNVTHIEDEGTGVQYEVDEAVTRAAVDKDAIRFSREATELCTLFANGTNTGLISLDGRTPNIFGSPAWCVLRQAVRTVLQHKAETMDLRVCGCLVKGTGEVADLLSAGVTEFRPLVVATSPVFGPIPHDTTLYSIYTETDLKEAIRKMGTAAGHKWSADTAFCVTLVHCFSTKTDVLTSSFMVTIYGSHIDYCTAVQQTNSRRENISALYRNLYRGSSATVMMVSLNEPQDSARSVALLMRTPKLKDPLREGTVSEFVRLGREKLEQRRLKTFSKKSEREHNNRLLRRIEAMVQDYETLLYEPGSNFPKSYTNESRQPSSPRRHSSASANAGERNPKLQDTTRVASPGTANGSPGLPAKPELLVLVEENSKCMKSTIRSATKVTMRSTKEAFETESVISFRGDSFNEETALGLTTVQSFKETIMEGRSCALVGIVDDTASVSCASQGVWAIFRSLLNECAFTDLWEKGSSVQLRFITLFDRTIIADHLLTEHQKYEGNVRAIIGASPLFGTVVRNCTVVEELSATACVQTTNRALRHLAAQNVPQGSLTVASAVFKQVIFDHEMAQPDIVMSSMTAFVVRAEKDLPTLRDMLALDPRAATPTPLFRYAIGGPCRLLCVTSLANCNDSRSADALRLSEKVRYLTSRPAPRSSVRKCIEQYRNRFTTTYDSMTDSQKRYVTSVIMDLEEILRDPMNAPAVVYNIDGPSGQHTPQRNTGRENKEEETSQGTPNKAGAATAKASASQPVQCTVVYTQDEGASNDGVTAQPDTRSVELADGSVFEFDEVLVRVGNSAVARSSFGDAIARRLTEGYNCSMLIADATGSQAGPSTLTRVVNHVLQAVSNDDAVTLYMSVVALQHDQKVGAPKDVTRDLLRVSEYAPLSMAVSPLFGSCINGAKFAVLNRVGDVFVTLKDALTVCATDKSALVVALVLKREVPVAGSKAVDVVMSSLFTVVTGPDNTASEQLSSQIFLDAVTDPQERSTGLLSGALGGPSFTYMVIGIAASTPPSERDILVRLGAQMQAIRSEKPNRGSVMELVEEAKRRLKESGGTPPDTWDWQRVLKDAQKMLDNTHDCRPTAYLLA